MKILAFIHYFVIFCLFSCSRVNHTTPSSISDSTIVNFYADSLILKEETKLLNIDSVRTNHQIDSLYDHYQLRRYEFHQKLEEIKQDIIKWRDFYNKVTKRLEYLQQEEATKKI